MILAILDIVGQIVLYLVAIYIFITALNLLSKPDEDN